jgi:zinc-binding alcohol dehydrogenase/oxidoreductase
VSTTGRSATIDLPSLYWWGRSILGAGGWDGDTFARVLAFVSEHRITPVVDTVAPFRELPSLLSRLEHGDVFGKLVVEM